MRLTATPDPALEAANLALSQRGSHPASRFASIELRRMDSRLTHLEPIGYFLSGALGVLVSVLLWML